MSDIRPARPIDGVNRIGGNEPLEAANAQPVAAEKQPEIRVEPQQMPPQPEVQQAIMSQARPQVPVTPAPSLGASVQPLATTQNPVPAPKRRGRKVLAAILILIAIALVAGALYYKLVLS